MNERINELIKQSYVTVRSQNDRDVTYFSQEKFAELIVRECAKALDDKLSNPNGANMAYCDGSDLLEHFGLEEE